MLPPVNPDIIVLVLLSLIGVVFLSCVIGLLWTVQDAFRSNAKLVETNRVLALGYANPDAALRLTQQETNVKRDAVLAQIQVAKAHSAKARSEQNAAGRRQNIRDRLPPHLKFHSAADADIVPPEDKK